MSFGESRRRRDRGHGAGGAEIARRRRRQRACRPATTPASDAAARPSTASTDRAARRPVRPPGAPTGGSAVTIGRRLVRACCRAGAARRAHWDSATDRTRRSGVRSRAAAVAAAGAGAAWTAGRIGWAGEPAPAAPAGRAGRRRPGREAEFRAAGCGTATARSVPVIWRICASSRSMRSTCSVVGRRDSSWPVVCCARLLPEHAADRRQRRVAVLGGGGGRNAKARRPRPLP